MKKKSKGYNSIIPILLSILVLVFGYKVVSYIRNYIEVNNYLKQYYTEYKITGVYKKNIKDSSSGSNHRCDYVYNVKVADSTNIVFHVGYCEAGNMFPTYKVVDDWVNYYVPYYAKKYNEENNTSIKVKINSNSLISDKDNYIYFNKNNKNDVYNFIQVLLEKSMGRRFQIYLYDEDKDNSILFSSWNDDYKRKFDYIK